MAPENAMKAIVYHEYGSPDVLEFQDVDKPVVKDDEVLVRVHAASGELVGPGSSDREGFSSCWSPGVG